MNPLVNKRCSPVEESIYQDGFQSGATSRDAEIQRLQFALADSEALELGTAERCDQLRAQINDMRAGMEEIVELSNCMWSCQKATELLASTPEQSLAASELRKERDALQADNAELVAVLEYVGQLEKERDQLREQVAMLRGSIQDAVDRLRNTDSWIWEDLVQALAATEPKT